MDSTSGLELRKGGGRVMLHGLYRQLMKDAPKDVHRFCDADVEGETRAEWTRWIRGIETGPLSSPQSLQAIFSFSVPTEKVLRFIVGLGSRIVSIGAGLGYWEYLLAERGADVVAIDNNAANWNKEAIYFPVQNGTPEDLRQHSDRILLMAWPDTEEHQLSPLAFQHYYGPLVVHIGELFGQTQSDNAWGQTTCEEGQNLMAKSFRCVDRVPLPNWPGHMDSLTVWSRVKPAVDCDGAMFHYVPPASVSWTEDEEE